MTDVIFTSKPFVLRDKIALLGEYPSTKYTISNNVKFNLFSPKSSFVHLYTIKLRKNSINFRLRVVVIVCPQNKLGM